MRDYRDISRGVLLRLGLGVEWRFLVESYVRYCMMMWGRGVKDVVGVRIEEDFDIRMDLRFYKKYAYDDIIYRRVLSNSIKHNRWVGYRLLLRRGLLRYHESGRVL